MNWSLNHNSAPTVVTVVTVAGAEGQQGSQPTPAPSGKPALSLMKSLRQPPGMSESYCIPQEELGGGVGGVPNLKEDLAFCLSPVAPQTEVA